MLAGAFAGIAVRGALDPFADKSLTMISGAHGDVPGGLDEGMCTGRRVKTRGGTANGISSQTRMQIINPAAGGLYTGLSHAMSTIYRIEGLRTLWRGVTSVIVGAGALQSRGAGDGYILTQWYRSCSCGLFWYIRAGQRSGWREQRRRQTPSSCSW
jgi:hypothetical protein